MGAFYFNTHNMATVKIKLGPKAASFSDPESGVILYPGETLETSDQVLRFSRINAALKGGHIQMVKESIPDLVLVVDEGSDKTPETGFIEAAGELAKALLEDAGELDAIPVEGKIEETTPDPLLAMTRKEILAQYKFLDEDDLIKAKNTKGIPELVAFLRNVEQDY